MYAKLKIRRFLINRVITMVGHEIRLGRTRLAFTSHADASIAVCFENILDAGIGTGILYNDLNGRAASWANSVG